MEYVPSLLIRPGDRITYTDESGHPHTATVTGPIHDYGDRPGRVVYIPVEGRMVNRLYVIDVERPDG